MGSLSSASAVPATAVAVLLGACSAPQPVTAPAAEVPQRVIALAPSAVELICALDWCDRLVGVGSYVSWPPETEDLPRLGGLVDADLERILLLEPELVVLLASEGDLAAKLTALGVEVLSVPTDSLGDIGRSAELIAGRFGDPDRGRQWRADLDAELVPRSPEDRPTVLLVAGRPAGAPSRLLVPGEDTYFGELVQRAGGDPVFDDFDIAYREVDLATVLAAGPEVILEFEFEAELEEGARAGNKADEWRRVYPQDVEPPCHVAIAGGHVVVPGPRVVELYADIVEALEGCR